MTLEQLFGKNLKVAQKQGRNHTAIDHLCGCTEHKIVLTEAEAEAGRLTFTEFLSKKLWNKFDADGWLFASPETQRNIGLIPYQLARQRLGLNRHCWDNYIQVY